MYQTSIPLPATPAAWNWCRTVHVGQAQACPGVLSGALAISKSCKNDKMGLVYLMETSQTNGMKAQDYLLSY